MPEFPVMPYAFIIEETSSKFFRLQIQSLVTKHVMVDQKESLVAAKGRARLKHNLRVLVKRLAGAVPSTAGPT